MIELVRLPNWRARFAAEVDRLKHTPFAWGAHDCGPGLAGNLVLALTGVDCAAQWRGSYSTAAEALALMKEAKFKNLGDMVAAMLPEIHPSAARIGDVAAIPVESPFGFALGVVNGERIFVLREDGLGTVDLLDATRAFRVG
ncbi:MULTISPECIES: hypothetical protein [unclassified Rhizobium]|uniref:DUF6950 family protein n=1 Tax=unclassified Rhizobium TaxID=2613769 RepID=UPI00160FD74D|nr:MULTISPECIES: hypothetical protein [unclassified Rhizobium]MBB3288152.1 hypothetical protein [Rhizobium sp. BK252]MBB3402984.1 hypothetical protein [Rhizobium sp. BK289]MBB3415561.1 hypothetical protein [Rhizobium sp. BK284]MBB3483358.1 hypothetical protein [Rhizobium sp. BK347]